MKIQTLEQLHAHIDFLKEQHGKFKAECPELRATYDINGLSPDLVKEAATYYEREVVTMQGRLYSQLVAHHATEPGSYYCISVTSVKCKEIVVSYEEVK